jgi:hypothetical protein
MYLATHSADTYLQCGDSDNSLQQQQRGFQTVAVLLEYFCYVCSVVMRKFSNEQGTQQSMAQLAMQVHPCAAVHCIHHHHVTH